MKKIQACASENGKSLWEIISDVKNYNVGINAGTTRKLEAFADLINLFIDDNSKSDAYALGQLIYNRTGILTSLAHDNTPESISKQENLSELLAGLKDFTESRREEEADADVSMRTFLSEVMLATDQDEKDEKDVPKVTLMTVHAAKGLEFKHIYVVGVEEELFPSSMSMDSLAQIEEERRLLYVAITRAKVTCTLTFAGSRFRNGQTMLTKPSRFLSDIDPRYLKLVSSVDIADSSDAKFINPASSYNRYERGDRPARSFAEGKFRDYGTPSSRPDYGRRALRDINAIDKSIGSGIKPMHTPDELAIGMEIEHPKLGIGTIQSMGNVQGEPTITVDFGVMGVKKLLLKFAKFTIL